MIIKDHKLKKTGRNSFQTFTGKDKELTSFQIKALWHNEKHEFWRSSIPS